jgi:hypothetical protein
MCSVVEEGVANLPAAPTKEAHLDIKMRISSRGNLNLPQQQDVVLE